MPAPSPRQRPSVDKTTATRDKLRKSLLSWYDQGGRDLPWRVRGGLADPYRVWLSEIMLQQTTVAAVTGYFLRFTEAWPNVAALAAANRDDLLSAWAGLGYYSRARNLHAAAQILATAGFPDTEAGWRALPGVGAYTAAAVAAIAFGRPANVVDGNVERVMSRLYAVKAPLPAAKAELKALAGALVTNHRPGDWAQALMDLGATVCTPRSPKCSACPWRAKCAAHAAGAQERYPHKRAKAARPERFGAAFVARRGAKVWLVRRPDQGLLGGMAGLPTSDWGPVRLDEASALHYAPVAGLWDKVGQVRHVFTHFTLTLDVYAARAAPLGARWRGEGWWGDVKALPTVFRKAAEL